MRPRTSSAWPSGSHAAWRELRGAVRAPRRPPGVRARIAPLRHDVLAGAIGSLPGFVDLGEVAPVKAAVPELAALPPEEAARGSDGSSTSPAASGSSAPSCSRADPRAGAPRYGDPARVSRGVVVHIVRDGRDVVCSLLEKPWLRREQADADDAGVPTAPMRGSGSSPSGAPSSRRPATRGEPPGSWRSYLSAALRARRARGALRADPTSDPRASAATSRVTSMRRRSRSPRARSRARRGRWAVTRRTSPPSSSPTSRSRPAPPPDLAAGELGYVSSASA